MRSLLSRLPNGAIKPLIRALSSAPVVPPRPQPKSGTTWFSPPHLSRDVLSFTRYMGKQTGDTLWVLSNRLACPNLASARTQALYDHGVSTDEYRRWRSVVLVHDMDSALQELAKHGISVEGDVDAALALDGDSSTASPTDPPTWLVVHLLCNTIRTPAHAQRAFALALLHLPAASPKLRPALLTLSALSLARHGLLPSLRTLVTAFLTQELPAPALHFNGLLLALARLPRSAEAARLSVAVLEAMAGRQVPLHAATYRALLADRFVTTELTTLLRERMEREGVRPTVHQLEAYLRVFADRGLIHDARMYGDAVKEIIDEDPSRRGRLSRTGVEAEYLRSFANDRTSAFGYLKSLVDLQSPSAATPQAPSDTGRTSEVDVTPSDLRRRERAPPEVNAYHLTTSIAVAARDRKTTTNQLLALFSAARRTRSGRFAPTLATWTIVLQGLLARGAIEPALALWHELLGAPSPAHPSGRLVLDGPAASAGAALLTAAGRARDAFALLADLPPGVVGTRAANGFMAALLRAGRADAALALWDHMRALWGAEPDAATLSTLLDAARVAGAGALPRWMRLQNPFVRAHRAEGPPPDAPPRDRAVHALDALLAGAARADGLWPALRTPAPVRARELFRQVVLGNWPHILACEPPARAVRLPDAGALGLRDMAHAFSLSSPPARAYALPLSAHLQVLAAQGLYPPGLYPALSPDDACFRAYIRLLAASARADEVPLALAWMREMGLRPSAHTVAVALIVWAEVGMRAPIVEGWMEQQDGEERSEYTKLLRWLEDWVGEEGMPDSRIMARWMEVMSKGGATY